MGMFKIIFKALFLFVLLSSHQSLNAQLKDVAYNVNGKPVTYHALSRDSSMNISLYGPGNLTLVTRARFTNESPDSLAYSIVYQIDNSKIKVYTAKKVIQEKNAVFILSSSDKPSISKTFTLKVDPDVHDIGFTMLNKLPQVDLYYKFVPDSNVVWKDMQSQNDTVEIRLMVDKGKSQSYYRISSSLSKKFKVKGPNSLRILARLEYDYTMQGLVSYRLMVKRNGIMLGTYRLSGSPSITQYVNDKNHIPGTLEKFFLDVPPGMNTYEFTILDKQFTSLIRVSRQKK